MRVSVTGLLLVLAATVGWGATERSGSEPTPSLRTWEVVRRDCRTSITRQEITLFGNGTLRLRLVAGEMDQMRLAELTPDEVQAYINRLNGEDLSEVAEGRDEALGAWVERCGLFLQLPERDPQRYFFSQFDSLPLALSRLNAVVDDMLTQVERLAPEGGLPRDYFPEPGDILERTDGHRFRVVALTSDRRGVELSGVEDPLTIFVALEEIRRYFVAVVQRRSFP